MEKLNKKEFLYMFLHYCNHKASIYMTKVYCFFHWKSISTSVSSECAFLFFLFSLQHTQHNTHIKKKVTTWKDVKYCPLLSFLLTECLRRYHLLHSKRSSAVLLLLLLLVAFLLPFQLIQKRAGDGQEAVALAEVASPDVGRRDLHGEAPGEPSSLLVSDSLSLIPA